MPWGDSEQGLLVFTILNMSMLVATNFVMLLIAEAVFVSVVAVFVVVVIVASAFDLPKCSIDFRVVAIAFNFNLKN